MVAPVKNTFYKQRRFISDASHELKTPLTIISANLELLQNEIGENQRIEHIKSQSERMNGLIHDMLTLAKADEGHTNTHLIKFDLSGVVLNTVLEFESRAFEEGKRYTFTIKENTAYVGDEKQIKQLLTILIDNALRYSDSNGKIEVSLRSDGKNHAHISVYNTGIGVPDKERYKIFERFYRTDESRSRETGGNGVGLSIAKAIVSAHRGKIVVSGKYKKWIRFEVTL
jgi:signal transduction histidine kinase